MAQVKIENLKWVKVGKDLEAMKLVVSPLLAKFIFDGKYLVEKTMGEDGEICCLSFPPCRNCCL